MDNMTPLDTPEQVRALRESMGMSQRKFAEWCNMSKSWVWSVESGRQKISWHVAEFIKAKTKQ